MTRYLYIIGSDAPPYKVGISKNPNARLRALQTGHPQRLCIHYTAETASSQTKLLETVVHRNLKSRHVNGEWFDVPLKELILEVEFVLIRYGEDQTLRTRINQNIW